MEEQINELGKIASSVSAIIALLALLLFNPIKKFIKRKRDERRKAKEEQCGDDRSQRSVCISR